MPNTDKYLASEDKKRRPAFSRWSSFSHLVRTLSFTPPSLAAAESRRSGFRFVPCFSALKQFHGQRVRFLATVSGGELPCCSASYAFLIMVTNEPYPRSKTLPCHLIDHPSLRLQSGRHHTVHGSDQMPKSAWFNECPDQTFCPFKACPALEL